MKTLKNRVETLKSKGQTNFEILETLLEEEFIYELTTSNGRFDACDVKEYCEQYASDFMNGSEEDFALNLTHIDELDEEAVNEALETICERTINEYIEIDEMVGSE